MLAAALMLSVVLIGYAAVTLAPRPAELAGVPNRDPIPARSTSINTRTLNAAVYANNGRSSGPPESDRRSIAIMPGWSYKGHTVLEGTVNGSRGTSWWLSDGVIKEESGIVREVWVEARAYNVRLFGPHNWIGARLEVYVEQEVDNTNVDSRSKGDQF